VSQSQASMTYWTIAVFASARVEVGIDCDGFYCVSAKNIVGIRFHFGDYGSIDQGSSLYTRQDHLLWTATSKVVYVDDSLFAWSAKEDCVGQRNPIHVEVMGEVA
jgi:hypothetical protein